MAKTHTENGQALKAGNMTGMDAQSTQEDTAALRESLTNEIAAVAAALPALDLKVNPKVHENGQQAFESRVMRDGTTAQVRALFVLSFNSPFSAGRTVIVGNSSDIRSAMLPFLSDPSIAEAIRHERRSHLQVKIDHAKDVVKRLESELSSL